MTPRADSPKCMRTHNISFRFDTLKTSALLIVVVGRFRSQTSAIHIYQYFGMLLVSIILNFTTQDPICDDSDSRAYRCREALINLS